MTGVSSYLVAAPPGRTLGLAEVQGSLDTYLSAEPAPTRQGAQVAPYEGPSYADLSPSRQRRVDGYRATLERGFRSAVADLVALPEGATTDRLGTDANGNPWRTADGERGWEGWIGLEAAPSALRADATPWLTDEPGAFVQILQNASSDPTWQALVREKLRSKAPWAAQLGPLPPPSWWDEPDSDLASLQPAGPAVEQISSSPPEPVGDDVVLPASMLPEVLRLASDQETRRILVHEDARRRAEELRRPPLEAFDTGTLTELLARPQPAAMRVDGLIPNEAGTLLSAQRKTGKTTLCLNLGRCGLTGEDFLGRFPVVRLTGNVTMLNFEVSGYQIARWAHEAGLDGERFRVVNLRGRANPLRPGSPDRARLAEVLRQHGTELLIVDPFGRAFTGTSQDSNGEVAAFLSDLDRFARTEVGATDLVLATHAGWNGERTRGASALEDWADSIIRLTRNDDGSRFLSAEGRDVLVEEDRLDFDHRTRSLTMSGAGSRRKHGEEDRLNDRAVHVLAAVEAKPGMNQGQIGAWLKNNRGDAPSFRTGEVGKVIDLLIARGAVVTERGTNNARLAFLAPGFHGRPLSAASADLSEGAK